MEFVARFSGYVKVGHCRNKWEVLLLISEATQRQGASPLPTECQWTYTLAFHKTKKRLKMVVVRQLAFLGSSNKDLYIRVIFSQRASWQPTLEGLSWLIKELLQNCRGQGPDPGLDLILYGPWDRYQELVPITFITFVKT